MLTPYDLYKAANRYITYDPDKSETVLYGEHLQRNSEDALTFEDFNRAMRDPAYRHISTANRLSQGLLATAAGAAALGVVGHGLYETTKGRPIIGHLPAIGAIAAAKGISDRYHDGGNTSMQEAWDLAVQRAKQADEVKVQDGKVTIPASEFKKEHVRLLGVLKSEDRADDRREYADQKKELDAVLKSAAAISLLMGGR